MPLAVVLLPPLLQRLYLFWRLSSRLLGLLGSWGRQSSRLLGLNEARQLDSSFLPFARGLLSFRWWRGGLFGGRGDGRRGEGWMRGRSCWSLRLFRLSLLRRIRISLSLQRLCVGLFDVGFVYQRGLDCVRYKRLSDETFSDRRQELTMASVAPLRPPRSDAEALRAFCRRTFRAVGRSFRWSWRSHVEPQSARQAHLKA